MFKLLYISLSLIVFTAAYPEVKLAVPNENKAVPSSGKSAQSGLLSSVPVLPPSANSISGEDDNDDSSTTPATGTAGGAEEAAAPALTPAGVTLATSSTPPTPAAVQARSSLLLTSLLKSSPGIQHHILPAQTIPLPITISTRPGLRTIIAPETITIQEPTVAKIGEVVQKIPTAVSHQSSTIVHKHARVVTPIVAPAVRTITSHVLRAYHTPIIYAPQTPTLRVVN